MQLSVINHTESILSELKLLETKKRFSLLPVVETIVLCLTFVEVKHNNSPCVLVLYRNSKTFHILPS